MLDFPQFSIATFYYRRVISSVCSNKNSGQSILAVSGTHPARNWSMMPDGQGIWLSFAQICSWRIWTNMMKTWSRRQNSCNRQRQGNGSWLDHWLWELLATGWFKGTSTSNFFHQADDSRVGLVRKRSFGPASANESHWVQLFCSQIVLQPMMNPNCFAANESDSSRKGQWGVRRQQTGV